MNKQREIIRRPAATPAILAFESIADSVDPDVPLKRYHALIRPLATYMAPWSNGSHGTYREVHPWTNNVYGEGGKITEGLYVGTIVTHLSLQDWLDLHHYRMEKLISERFASAKERTLIQ